LDYDIGEHPPIYPKRLSYDNAILFFLTDEVLGGYFNTMEESIGIYSYCPYMAKDLPYIDDVVYTVDHEYIHWLLYMFVDDWASHCFDKICNDINDWMTGWDNYIEELAYDFSLTTMWWSDSIEIGFGYFMENQTKINEYIKEWIME